MGDVMSTWATALGMARRQRGWSQLRLVCELRAVADEGQRKQLPGDESLVRRISSWENGAHQPDELYQKLLTAVFPELAAGQIGDRAVDSSPVPQPSPHDQGMTAGLATVKGFLGALTSSRANGDDSIDPAHIEDMRQVALAHRRSYRYLSAQALLPQALAHMHAVIDLRPGSQPAEVRRELVSVIGEMAALIGALTTLDRRDFGSGDSYLEVGVTAAKEAGNDDLLAFALGVRAFHAAYSGQLRQGLDYAEGSVTYAHGRASHTTQGWLAAVASELHAADHNDYRCRAYLDQAEIALTNAEAHDQHPWVGLGLFDLAKLRAYRGGDLARLGQHHEAQAELTAALAALPSSALKHRATACIDLAEAHLGLREIDATCARAEQALQLTERTRHADSLRRIQLIYRQARDVDRQAAAVRSLGERLLVAR